MIPTCSHCGATARRADARFCGKCGARLIPAQVYQPPVTWWKSIPAPIRLAIWFLAIPPLVGFAFWALLFLALLSPH